MNFPSAPAAPRQTSPPAAPVAFVTGASRGIGAATALALAQAGWRVVVSARTTTEGQALAHQLRRPDGTLLAGSLEKTVAAITQRGGEAVPLHMDLMDPTSIDTAADAALAAWGRIDLLINNAVYQDRESNALLADLSDERLLRTLQGNVVAPTRLVRRLLPAWLAQGGAQVVNVSSGAGKFDPPLRADQGGWGFAYGASKAALARLAGCLNREHGHQGLRAFTVNPGLVSTEAVTATLGDDGALARQYGAFTPDAIARVLLWLITAPEAPMLVNRPGMLDLQTLAREHGLV